MKKIIGFVLVTIIMVSALGMLSASAYESVQLAFPDEYYKDITTEDIWYKMQIQVLEDKADGSLIIRDGDKYYKTDSPRPVQLLLKTCDIDNDGEYELLFTTQYGSGKRYEYLWCYSKTKEINCAFGVDASYEILSNAAVKKNYEGGYNLCILGNNDGKLAIEQIDGKYWLTVTYPEDAVFDSVATNPEQIEHIKTGRTNRGQTAVNNTKDDVVVHILVELVTPSVAAMKLKLEGKMPELDWEIRDDVSLEEQALEGHTKFEQQLDELLATLPESTVEKVEITARMYSLVNMIGLYVPNNIVDLIAELPEVDFVCYNELALIDPDPPGAAEEFYNVSFYTDVSQFNNDIVDCKITSYEELVNQFPNCQDLLSKYDEAFFENKILYRIGYLAPDSSFDVRVDSVVYSSNDSATIRLNLVDKEELALDAEVPWDIILEFDMTYLNRTISTEVEYDRVVTAVQDNAFGESTNSLVEITPYPGDKNKIVKVGNTELYYSSQKDAYIGIVRNGYVSSVNFSVPVVISNGTPTTFIYGNLDDDDVVDASDLQAMKLVIKGSKALEGKYLIASDVDGDGLFDGADLQALKLKLKSGKEFPVLK